MIPLQRLRSNPPIDAKFIGAKLAETSLKLLQDERDIRKGSLEKHSFDSSIWKKAKSQLLAETHDKCAYCETPTAVVTFGDVEHYRPKSKYWWLAYCLDNYLASCAICNQKFKKDKFLIKNPGLRPPRVRSNSTDSRLETLAQSMAPDPLDTAAVADFKQKHTNEGPLLINPYVDDPSDVFAWRADEQIQEVELIANPQRPNAADFVEAAEDIYGLNRSQLRRERYPTFRAYTLFKRALLEPAISASLRADVENEIGEMVSPESKYAGMIRFYESAGAANTWEAQGFLIPKQ